MSKKYKVYSASFKSKAIRELLKDELAASEIASKYGITTKTIHNWHNQFLNGNIYYNYFMGYYKDIKIEKIQIG